MSENNDKRDFIKGDDEKYSPRLVIRKKAKESTAEADTDTEVKEKSKLRLWSENFWYHYKWHSIAALFIVLVVIFCTLQMCQKVSYDAHLLYAGGKSLRGTEENETETAYRTIYDTLGRYVPDADGDGNRNLAFLDIYLPSSEEIEAEKANGDGVNYTLLAENDELFRQNMLIGDYYVCLISERLLEEWTKDEKNNPFKAISEYLPEGATVATADGEAGYLFASEYGIYLHSVPSAARPGLKDLPDDTVICIRKLSGIGDSKKSTAAKYATAEQMLKLILADKTPD